MFRYADKPSRTALVQWPFLNDKLRGRGNNIIWRVVFRSVAEGDAERLDVCLDGEGLFESVVGVEGLLCRRVPASWD
jgi:hypothetical protein